MFLLHSLTGATPETRLVLLAWAARFGAHFRSGKKDTLAAELGVSNRHFRVALEFLVREGYIWEIKRFIKRPFVSKSDIQFDYGLTTRTWQMWNDILITCPWAEELRPALFDFGLQEVLSPDNAIVMTETVRLVRVALLMKSNNAGYVIGCDNNELSKMLGITEVKVRQAIRTLAKMNSIAIVANGVARSKILNRLLPIYQIRPKLPNMCTIKLGVSISSLNLLPLQFTGNLDLFYRRTLKGKSVLKEGYPRHDSSLSDKDYFELSTMFNNKKLITSIHHLCLSIILSLIPDYVSSCMMVGTSASLSKKEYSDSLRGSVQLKLAEGLAYDLLTVPDVGDDKQKASRVNDIAIMKDYIFNELTAELVKRIEELSKPWRLFVDIYHGKAKIIGYLRHHHMLAGPIETSKVATQTQYEGPEGEQDKRSETFTQVSCVFEVYVPKDHKFDDCMILADELLTVNQRVIHQRIRIVEKLICGKQDEIIKKQYVS
ncbi:hypothetical protein [Shewanella xiamenensis]|uniref:hypothetical protein n=1 Tax=Shewanella xiamenensis TaxID=332186 RepID=UPI001185703E|nr:hypothetical protein [Shewanella xiamenensis]TVL32900.1 hypothetical protein AYI95_08225 [Shewanella xiamenensis]